MRCPRLVATCLQAAAFSAALTAAGQQTIAGPRMPGPPVEKIRDGVFRVGTIEVDTIKKEARVAGIINSDIRMLEWIANTSGGQKAYESAMTVDASAFAFNAAMLVLGLDPAHARVPTRHFDPVAPRGDPVEVWLEWPTGASVRRVRIEELLYDERTRTTLPSGPWVYTGSSFVNGRFMSDLDGVLIGFVHSPSPIIENPRSGAVDAFGKVTMNNERLGLPGGSKVTLIIKALVPFSKGLR